LWLPTQCRFDGPSQMFARWGRHTRATLVIAAVQAADDRLRSQSRPSHPAASANSPGSSSESREIAAKIVATNCRVGCAHQTSRDGSRIDQRLKKMMGTAHPPLSMCSFYVLTCGLIGR
jgi:hypothetical protein